MNFSSFFSFLTEPLVVWCARGVIQIMEVRIQHRENGSQMHDRIGMILEETKENYTRIHGDIIHQKYMNQRKSLLASRIPTRLPNVQYEPLQSWGRIRKSSMGSTINLSRYPISWIHKLHKQGRKQWSDQQLHVLWSGFDLTIAYL